MLISCCVSEFQISVSRLSRRYFIPFRPYDFISSNKSNLYESIDIEAPSLKLWKFLCVPNMCFKPMN